MEMASCMVVWDLLARYSSDYKWFDLQKVAGWVDEGKLNPIVGRTVKLKDIKAVREACVQMSSASRSIGKTVIEII
jgi:NADPH:quinone reductase-like Zn-dependent oxidoreductase